MVIALCFSLVNMRQAAFLWHVGLLGSLFNATICYGASIRASGFYYGYKTRWWVLGSPTCSFVIVALRFY
jgi:hypothetical protein